MPWTTPWVKYSTSSSSGRGSFPPQRFLDAVILHPCVQLELLEEIHAFNVYLRVIQGCPSRLSLRKASSASRSALEPEDLLPLTMSRSYATSLSIFGSLPGILTLSILSRPAAFLEAGPTVRFSFWRSPCQQSIIPWRWMVSVSTHAPVVPERLSTLPYEEYLDY